MEDGVLCTLDELTGLVESALAVDYPGAPTGRVRDVPDQRAIRWYVTRGLVDRPVASRGRVALYGRRHLLQLVAIKRRQAEGRSLADIQAELAGATDDTLAAVARLTAGATTSGTEPPAVGHSAGHSAGHTDRLTAGHTDGHTDEPLPRRARFWADRPPQPSTTSTTSTPNTSAPTAQHERANRRTRGELGAVELYGVRLAPGVTLLIEDGVGRVVDPLALQAAARPLLDLLAVGEQASPVVTEE
jgi:DNA-binding transcriptional MerR regulator